MRELTGTGICHGSTLFVGVLLLTLGLFVLLCSL